MYFDVCNWKQRNDLLEVQLSYGTCCTKYTKEMLRYLDTNNTAVLSWLMYKGYSAVLEYQQHCYTINHGVIYSQTCIKWPVASGNE